MEKATYITKINISIRYPSYGMLFMAYESLIFHSESYIKLSKYPFKNMLLLYYYFILSNIHVKSFQAKKKVNASVQTNLHYLFLSQMYFS